MGAASHPSDLPDGGIARLTIGSRLEDLALVHSLIEGISRQHEVDEETTNALLIAVIEAGTNAIQHGNVFSEEKTVTFDFWVSAVEFLVRIDDYGEGFNPDRIGNPTDASHLLSPNGRGIYLMRSLVDEVTFRIREDHGTTVLLRKALPTRSG